MKILNFEENNTKVTFNNLNMLKSGKKNEGNIDKIIEFRIKERNIKETTLRDKDIGILPVGSV